MNHSASFRSRCRQWPRWWLAAVPLLGESLDALTLLFAVAVAATVMGGRRQALPPPALSKEPA